jgi:hypothetical protein
MNAINRTYDDGFHLDIRKPVNFKICRRVILPNNLETIRQRGGTHTTKGGS